MHFKTERVEWKIWVQVSKQKWFVQSKGLLWIITPYCIQADKNGTGVYFYFLIKWKFDNSFVITHVWNLCNSSVYYLLFKCIQKQHQEWKPVRQGLFDFEHFPDFSSSEQLIADFCHFIWMNIPTVVVLMRSHCSLVTTPPIFFLSLYVWFCTTVLRSLSTFI